MLLRSNATKQQCSQAAKIQAAQPQQYFALIKGDYIKRDKLAFSLHILNII